MSKYEERVKQRSYEFARDKYKQSFYQVQAGPPMPYSKFNEDNPFAQKAIASISESYILAARLSVQREADSVHKALQQCDYEQDDIIQYLTKAGLIPPPNETT